MYNLSRPYILWCNKHQDALIALIVIVLNRLACACFLNGIVFFFSFSFLIGSDEA